MFIKNLEQKINEYLKTNNLPSVNYVINKLKNLKFGDFSCNILMVLSNYFQKNHSLFNIDEWGKKFVSELKILGIKEIKFQKPGFLNFYLGCEPVNDLAKNIKLNLEKFGQQPLKNKKYFVELVSANPTGFLHIGHARNGVFGDALSNLLKTAGYETFNEYLINDAGSQVKKLAFSVLIRYLNLCNIDEKLPDDSYHGNDIVECAKELYEKHEQIYKNVSYEDQKFKTKSEEDFFVNFGVAFFLKNIKSDLKKYNISIDNWFSEQEMHEKEAIKHLMIKIKKDLYEKDGAIWFSSSKYIEGNKDEVLVKSNQTSTTYYAQDIAYHKEKLEKFPEPCQLINVFGADHHGHVIRLQAFFKSLGYENDKVVFLITQLIRLIKNGSEVKMSKRTGNSLTMREMHEMVGYDALRWYLVSQSINSHIDINLDLIKEKGPSNQIYYVMYAYARIWQILLKCDNQNYLNSNLHLLIQNDERNLINQLLVYEQTIINAAKSYEPHKICNYLYELAKHLHVYYNNYQILKLDNLELMNQRLHLIYLVQQIIYNGLAILKITPKKQM